MVMGKETEPVYNGVGGGRLDWDRGLRQGGANGRLESSGWRHVI